MRIIGKVIRASAIILVMMLRLAIALFLLISPLIHADELFLKNNLKQASAGDYIVAVQGKSITLLHIFAKNGSVMTLEEVTIPKAFANHYVSNWRTWLESDAEGHSSWVMYQIDLDYGQILSCYSFTRQGWYHLPESENFLGNLLNLELYRLPYEKRRKVGALSKSTLWQPQMVVEGQIIENVPFEAYVAFWPKDGSQLSGKKIEIYLPNAEGHFPVYFPYWLQVSGMVGKATVRIIDSGSNLRSPKAGLPQ